MCPEIYPWTGVTERYQDMLDTGQEFTSLSLVTHRVGRWVERVGGGVKSSCGVVVVVYLLTHNLQVYSLGVHLGL